MPSLHDAIIDGNSGKLKELIAKGFNLNEFHDGNTPLTLALNLPLQEQNIKKNCSCYYECAMILIEAGADLNLFDHDCYTPLHLVIYGGKDAFPLLEILLNKKINVDAINSKGDTPLHIACAHNLYETAKLLLNFNGNCNIKNKTGYTPLGLLISKEEIFNTAYIKTLQIFTEFLAKQNLKKNGKIFQQEETIKNLQIKISELESNLSDIQVSIQSTTFDNSNKKSTEYMRIVREGKGYKEINESPVLNRKTF